MKLLKYWFAEALYKADISSAESERLKTRTSSIEPFQNASMRSSKFPIFGASCPSIFPVKAPVPTGTPLTDIFIEAPSYVHET